MRQSITYKSFAGWDDKERWDYLYSRTNIKFENFHNFESGICQAVKLDNGIYWSHYSDSLESFLPMKHDMKDITTLDYGSVTEYFPQDLIRITVGDCNSPIMDNVSFFEIEDFLIKHCTI